MAGNVLKAMKLRKPLTRHKYGTSDLDYIIVLIDFFGEEVDSIRSFNIENQLSIDKRENVSLVPDLSKMNAEESVKNSGMIPLSEYLPAGTIWWTVDLAVIKDRMDEIVSRSQSISDEDQLNNDYNAKDTLVDGKTFTASP